MIFLDGDYNPIVDKFVNMVSVISYHSSLMQARITPTPRAYLVVGNEMKSGHW